MYHKQIYRLLWVKMLVCLVFYVTWLRRGLFRNSVETARSINGKNTRCITNGPMNTRVGREEEINARGYIYNVWRSRE